MIPSVTFDVAQIQEAQTESPVPLIVRQTDQPFGDTVVLSVQLRPVAVASPYASRASLMLEPRSLTAHLATSRRRDGLSFFCEGLRDDVRLDVRLDIQLLQPPVLLLKLLHPSHQRGVHTAEFRPPLVERRRADPVLSADLWYRNPGSACFKTARIWPSVNLDFLM